MNRRSFLMKLGAGMFGALVVRPTIDVNQIFQVGTEYFKVTSRQVFTETDIVAAELERMIPHFQRLFERDDKFYSMIKSKTMETLSNREMKIPIGF